MILVYLGVKPTPGASVNCECPTYKEGTRGCKPISASLIVGIPKRARVRNLVKRHSSSAETRSPLKRAKGIVEKMVADCLTTAMEVAKGIEAMEPSAYVPVVALHHRKMNRKHKNITLLPGIREKAKINEDLDYTICRLRRQIEDHSGLR